MKQLFKLKFKMHKLVNIIFYLIIFLIGFLIGLGVKKISFNNVLSRVLMIDNVEAYTIKIGNRTFNEEFIVNELNKLNGFDINEFPYIYIWIQYGGRDYEIKAFNETGYDCFMNKTTKSSDSYFDIPRYMYKMTNDCPGGRVASVYFSSGSYNPSFTNISNYGISNYYVYPYQWKSDNKYYYFATNFDLAEGYGSQWDVNKLDFSLYTTPDYHLNDGSIFKDENHQDFKEVCWENFDNLTFSITIDSTYDGSYNVYEDGQQDGETYVRSGFYVFDDISKLKRGSRRFVHGTLDYEHKASTWLSGLTFEHLLDIKDSFQFLKDENLLNSRYADVIDALGNYDIERGDSYYYDNLSLLKNSFYIDFLYYYNVIDDYWYDVFQLNEKKEKFCIYIPNTFIVTTLELNELGGIVGDVPLHTDENETFIDNTITTGKIHENQLFSILNQFLKIIKGSVNFINSYIYKLFISMPAIVQMFIYSFLTLSILIIIIRMVTK